MIKSIKYMVILVMGITIGIIMGRNLEKENTSNYIKENNNLLIYFSSSERLLDKVFEHDEAYYLDVLSETQEYEDYANSCLKLKEENNIYNN